MATAATVLPVVLHSKVEHLLGTSLFENVNIYNDRCCERRGPITDLEPKVAYERLGEFQLIDVRRPDEYTGELGHIENTILATLGPELSEKLQTLDRSRPSLFVCRSGGRSAKAAQEAQALGFAKVYNLEGGMLEWNKQGLPIA